VGLLELYPSGEEVDRESGIWRHYSSHGNIHTHAHGNTLPTLHLLRHSLPRGNGSTMGDQTAELGNLRPMEHIVGDP